MGTTVLLSQLTAATELLIINLVTQQHPEPDSPRMHRKYPECLSEAACGQSA
jgi:hypothetical protein